MKGGEGRGSYRKPGRCNSVEEVHANQRARSEIGKQNLKDIFDAERGMMGLCLKNDEGVGKTYIAPGTVTERSALRYCYQLLEFVAEKHDDAKLKLGELIDAPANPRSASADAAAWLEKKCMSVMLRLEGTDEATERELKRKEKTPTYRGVGKRVAAYKKQLMELKGKKIPIADQKLYYMEDFQTEVLDKLQAGPPTNPPARGGGARLFSMFLPRSSPPNDDGWETTE
ncbi:MAG: hypothetical protein SGILL_009203 [Bacillariaceae sp.]